MLSIGPYVVVRQIPTRTPSAPGNHAGKTYRATERLTGIPVLLHHQTSLNGVPSLPAHRSLLPFTDVVVQSSEAFLVTELPPNALPARDPVQAARGALAALAALHESGLAHGGVNTAQLWSVDGPVRLAGGGRFELGGEFTAARDLRDLALALDDLGGLPPALALLRTGSDRLSAAQALELLESAEVKSAPTPDARFTAPITEKRGVRFEASSAEIGESPASSSDSGLQPSSSTGGDTTSPRQQLTAATPLDIGIAKWDASLPDSLLADARPRRSVEEPESAADLTPVAAPQTTPPLPETPTSSPISSLPEVGEQFSSPHPTSPAASVANQALQRLKNDGQRLRAMQEVRRDEAAAQLGELDGQRTGSIAGQLESLARGGESLSDTSSTETPQERRRREHQARLEEERLAGQLEAKRASEPQSASASAGTASTASTTLVSTAASEVAADPGPTVQRQLKSVKMRWDERTSTWQRADETGRTEAQDIWARLPAWVWLAVALVALLLLLGLGIRAARHGSADAVNPSVPSGTAAPANCCAVEFKVQGGSGKAKVSLVNTTSKGNWQPGQELGQVPGTLTLPGAGTYTLEVSSEGFTPALINNVTVPRTAPVTINLGQ